VIEPKIKIGHKLAPQNSEGPELFDFTEGELVGTAGFELV
jgi:hypothetical protein